MKKSSLLKMKNLPATEEMLAVVREDVPVKVGSGWNTFYRCRYSGFVRSAVEGGILKVTLYDPDAMRLGGTLPVYEIFMEKEKQQFLTYDRAHDKWRTAKINYLEWQAKGSNNVWISAVDDAQIRQYLASDEKSVYRAILKFQRAVRDAELERRHRKEPIHGTRSSLRRRRCRRTGSVGSIRWVFRKTTSSMITARAGQGTATALIVKRKSH